MGAQHAAPPYPVEYVFIDLSCITILQCRGLIRVSIWEHARDGKIKNIVRAIDALDFICRGKMMASDDKTRNEPESSFSFGVRELRARQAQPLTADVERLEVVNENRGVDPYNTSGSFDRKNNWSRVGRR